MKIITRFPPSPTGKLQLGNVRTALFNFLFARHNGGQFLFRIEDTDRERSKKEYEEDAKGALAWLGLSHDNAEVWRQSERGEIYKKYLKKLVDSGFAYISKEADLPAEAVANFQSPKRKEVGRRDEVVRFKNPNKKIVFNDLIRGEISFDSSELGDFVIAKSMEEPIYHLAVVIDDTEMKVTHVIRGEDGISNTPRQILIAEALGFERPTYAHIPLILAPDRSKLSKRHGAVSVTEYRDRGYFPEAIINYLALLGWNPGTDQEIFSMEELIKTFDLAKVQKGGAIFSEEKLRWTNKEYLNRAGVDAILPRIPTALRDGRDSQQIRAIAEMFLGRISVLGDIEGEITAGELDYLLKEPSYPKELLKWKKATSDPKPHLEKAIAIFEKMAGETFTSSEIKSALMAYAEANGKGNVLWPIRVALSGKDQSPDPFSLAGMLGRTISLLRLKRAASMLQ